MKRLLCLLLLVVFIIGVVGCGEEKPKDAKPAVDKAKDAAKDATDAAKDATDAAKDAAKDATN